MKQLEQSEILNLVEYEKVCVERRREIVRLQQARRVSLGRYLTFVFENHATVRFQIQEVVRAERIVGDFESGHSDEERGKLSAVHFVRFAVPRDARARFLTSEVVLIVEHPNERACTVLSDATKQSPLDDLA